MCRFNNDDSAICFVDYCCGMLIFVVGFFFAAVSEESIVVLWALGRVTAPHGHRTARPTHALHNAPRWRRLKPFA